MAKFIFTGTITVQGGSIRTQKDAINALNVMLGDFDDMNPDFDGSVTVHWDKIEKGKADKD